MKIEVVEETEVDESEHGRVELDEDGHQLQVDVLRLVVGKAVRYDPGHQLSHNFSLIVVALDGDKDLFQGPVRKRSKSFKG